MKVASFNAQRFGVTKASEPEVLSALVQIVSRYDIIVILEVVDVSGTSIKLLLTELNRVNTSRHYALQLSARLGRSRYKEQFMFLYRDDVVDLIDTYQYEDDQENSVDAFVREPYILYFKPRHAVMKDLVLIPVRASPSDARKEMEELYEVFLVVKDKWKTDNVMILGDFGTEGASLTPERVKDIHICTDKNFHWLIANDVDTTVKMKNNYNYDRIIVYGDDMLAAIVPNSAKPFNFQKVFGLKEEMALRVSDRYPVEVEFISSPPFWEQQSSGSCVKKKASQTPVCSTSTENYQEDVVNLKKETLSLEKEKLKLQISLLKRKLASYD